MTTGALYRVLVPDAPQHRRTEGDEHRDAIFTIRARSTALLRGRKLAPGLQTPELVSSCDGSIDRILFCLPSWSATESDLSSAYQSVVSALRVGTRFIVVHHESIRSSIEPWFAGAGHAPANVEFIPVANYVSLTDWAEDAYVSLRDAKDGSHYLMEPWEFKRAGDALIADVVEGATDIKASQAPLVFQGGNCLIGDTFWLLGKDYFADTLHLLQDDRPPIKVPAGGDPEAFVRKLFGKYVDARRKLIVIGANKPIPIGEFRGTHEGADYFLDIAGNGAGTFQPIFHIDMFLTLLGVNSAGKFQVMVGSPALADARLGTTSPFGLNDVYDGIAGALQAAGFAVIRNPLVHRPRIGGSFTLEDLKQLASERGKEALAAAVKELSSGGAVDDTVVRVRDWYHITWNNCLVENSGAVGRHVYLPSFGHGDNLDLKVLDDEMAALWTKLGFTVHLLGDFSPFAARQGVVHCIKKYIARGR